MKIVERKYIILRSNNNRPKGKATSFGASAETAGFPKVEVVSAKHTDVARIARDRTVLALAPAVPLKLIKPQILPTGVLPESRVAWGINAIEADRSPYTGEGIVLAILDTGIDSNHSAFADMKLVQKDFTGEGNGDSDGHGTHCAGIAFGRAVDDVRIGVATGVRRALIAKVLGKKGSSSDQLIRAIHWAADMGACVISMSLGMDFPSLVAEYRADGYPETVAVSMALEGYALTTRLFESLTALMSAQARVGDTGAVIVAATGNESMRDKKSDWIAVASPPASAAGILSVAALSNGTAGNLSYFLAPFSNAGAAIAAPGVEIISARAGGGLEAMSGTSMATPHVAGIAALWAQKLASSSPRQLRVEDLTSRLLGNVRDLPNMDRRDIGTGLVLAPR